MNRISTAMKWTVTALVLASIAMFTLLGTTLYFGLRPNPAKNMIEGVYQSNFYQLAAAMDGIEENMAILTVASSPESQQKIVHRIWRQSGEAEVCLAGLPVDHTQLTESYVFLNRLGGYLYSLSEKLAGGETFSGQDRIQIGELYEETARISGKLDELRATLTDYRFYDRMDPTTTDPLGYAMNDCKCPELDYTADFSAAAERKDYGYLDGLQEIDEETALKRAQTWIGGLEDARYTGWDTDAPACYVYETNNGLLELTKRGGLISTMTSPSSDGDADWQADDAIAAARELVEKAYGETFEVLQTRIGGNVATVCLAPLRDGVVFENHAVSVGVDLTEGRISGVNALSYFATRNAEGSYTPTFTAAEAALRVHSSLTDRFVRLAVIRHSAAERLVYEFTGMLAGRTYMVRIDAVTGDEIDVLRVAEDVI